MQGVERIYGPGLVCGEDISILQGVERIYGPGLMHYTGCGEDKHSAGCGEDIWAGADALYRVWRG